MLSTMAVAKSGVANCTVLMPEALGGGAVVTRHRSSARSTEASVATHELRDDQRHF
jgi:hypothetical protein